MASCNVWVINPKLRNGRKWIEGDRVETKRFSVGETEIHVDLQRLFVQPVDYEG